ncbi:HEAT repeat domain-containing protein [Methanoculleus sp. FWC-SCC1]|uniref:HEAT repeat domain-containing protein n=1 Tax=Methanoculleus frigidifontis TaxID=2584085 RepID=A0ABT8MCC8_9EURY|nr:HEAT repeat domain-containing protein [Methanoculleus sp. FWC-SCC1]MDN7025588.1 HEAT repeat domain-containing protein [Methanoculleus sp. FWC-SCC1]
MQRRDVTVEETQERKRYNVDLLRSEGDVDGLIAALDSSDVLTRQRAALALGTLGDPAAVNPLIRALGDPAVSVREAAADSLALMGGPAVEPLIDVLEHPEWSERYEWRGESREGMAQHELFGGPAAVSPAEKESLRRENLPQHDMYAGPGDIGPKKGLREGDMTQQDLLGGPANAERKAKEQFREEPLTQHQMFGGPTDVGSRKPLRHGEMAQHDIFGGPADVRGHEALHRERGLAGAEAAWTAGMRHELRRVYAAAILGEIADPRAIGPLVRALTDRNDDVRCQAAGALAKFGTAPVEPLTDMLQSPDPDARITAAGILGDIRDPFAVEPLIDVLHDENDDVRGAAGGALVQIGSPAVPLLIDATQDPNRWVRLYAAGALGFIGDPRAVDPLRRLTHDPDDDVRNVAEDALRKIQVRQSAMQAPPPPPTSR